MRGHQPTTASRGVMEDASTGPGRGATYQVVDSHLWPFCVYFQRLCG